jgi:hypothetical protein
VWLITGLEGLRSGLAQARRGKRFRSGVVSAPEQAALSWFVAINHKDRAAVLAHFERAPGEGTWENGD